MNRSASAFILLLVLCSAFVLLAEIGIVYAGGTIYIRADGSIEGTDKIQRDGNVYTFTGDISDSIVVERDNIVVDGAGHVLEGAGAGRGIFLEGRSNITIKNITIREFDFGIDLWNSSGNTISANAIANTSTGIYLVSSSDSNSVSANTMANNQWGISLTGASNNSVSANNITNNDVGISLAGGSNNSISANNITNNNVYGISLSFISNNSISANSIANNTYGIYLYSPSGSNSMSANNIVNNDVGIYFYSISNNLICHNNFVGNTVQAQVTPFEYVNVWDDSYPSGGNYWSDYSGVDLNRGPYQNETGSDGIGDTNYTISTGNNDRYPLMGPISTFDCGAWDNKSYYADIISNSTISAFNFNVTQRLISFNVNGSFGTIGFCKITIGNALLGGPYIVLVDETPVTPSVTSNGTHSFLYFTYAHSSHNVSIIGSTVIPESWIVLPLLMMGTLFAVAVRKKISRQAPQKG
jgi:parallel beta-helix repeat protein